MPFVKLRIRARIGQARGAHARSGIPGRLRGLAATALVLTAATGGLAAYGLTASTPASAHTVGQAPVAAAPVLITGKTANPASFSTAGQVITYTFTVTNRNSVGFLNVRVTDSRVGANCSLGDIPPAPSPSMPVVRTCTKTYTITAADVRAGFVSDTAELFVRGIRSGLSPTVTIRLRTSVPVTG
jgi:hypothetical protein